MSIVSINVVQLLCNLSTLLWAERGHAPAVCNQLRAVVSALSDGMNFMNLNINVTQAHFSDIVMVSDGNTMVI